MLPWGQLRRCGTNFDLNKLNLILVSLNTDLVIRFGDIRTS